jgi:lipoic acid synthetase
MSKYKDIKMTRLPEWLKRKTLTQEDTDSVKRLLRRKELKTVCEEAKCPNISECFKKPTATFMILGDTCTRACKFCNVKTGHPNAPDPHEPENVALSVKELNLKHVVITSVDRDDLPDLGVTQFVKTIREIRKIMPLSTTIEILTPDFQGKKEIINELKNEDYQIFNHNLETVKSLFKEITPKSNYEMSLELLKFVKLNHNKISKTGLIVGLGETQAQVLELFDDIVRYNLDALTIGQYLRPTRDNYPVMEYIKPEIFDFYKKEAENKGIKYVASSPYVRSSYNAEELIGMLNK